MKCSNCRFENRRRSAFCGHCGGALFRVCPRCGTESPAANVFCDRCGCDLGHGAVPPAVDYTEPHTYTPKSLADRILTARSRIEGERKLVTVLFADVADYTSLSEKLDPEEVHQIMGGCFQVLLAQIHAYEGTVDKFTGDGVMALFGAPLTHEDHAQRGCLAALSIRRAMREYGEKVKEARGVEFRMRIGLNSGRVVVASVGDDLRMDYTAIGDTVNLASRMEGLARPGAVWVSGNTHRLVRDFFTFEGVGRLPVKGKEEPQEVYELLEPTSVETRFEAAAARGLTRFVGRSREMEVLHEAFAKARSGSGQVVAVRGDAGVGKSRLLREFRSTLPEGKHHFLSGSCLHYGTSVLYLPILDALKSYFRIRREDREEEIQRKIRQGLERLDGEIGGSLPPLQDLLSLTVGDDRYLQIDPQQRRQKTFEALRALLVSVSKATPLVLAMEDLHWIDRTSQDFLDFFADAVSNARILLILLYRPEYGRARGTKPHCREIPLNQLVGETSSDLVRAVFEQVEIEPELMRLILGRAGGNPLFVEELARSLLENGSILRKDGRFVLAAEASEIRVPDTIQGIIAGRIDRLEEDLKRILQAAAVIGREFSYRILQAVRSTEPGLKPSLLRLQGLEFLYERQFLPEPAYTFKHVLTQEVAYNSLLLKRRRELHEKIGEAVERVYADRLEEHYEILAYHYAQSDNAVKAVEYLDRASRKAANANAPEDAKECFDKAMDLLDTLPDTEENRERRVSLFPHQSNVFWKLLKGTEYYELLIRYEPVAAGLKNLGLRGAYYARMGLNEAFLGHLDQGIRNLNKALRLLATEGDLEETGIAYYCLAVCHFLRCDYDRGFQCHEEYLRTMGDRFHLGSYVRLASMVAQAYAQLGRWNEAVEINEKALTAARDHADNSSIAQAECCFAAIYTYKRDLDRAIAHGERAVQKAATPADKATAQAFLAWPLCHVGEPGRGTEALKGLVPIFKAVRLKWWELWGTFFLAEGYWLAGEHEEARQSAEELLAIAESCGAVYFIGYAHFLLGDLSIGTDPPQAETSFHKSLSLFRAIKAENAMAMAYAGYGRLHKRKGDVARARDYLTRALAIFERLGTLVEPDKVRRELAAL